MQELPLPTHTIRLSFTPSPTLSLILRQLNGVGEAFTGLTAHCAFRLRQPSTPVAPRSAAKSEVNDFTSRGHGDVPSNLSANGREADMALASADFR